MCRWGCDSTNTTFMCKWCGTWFCRLCLRGAYKGVMEEPLKCRVCFQKKCQGARVDYVERPAPPPEDNAKGPKSVGNLKTGRAALSKVSKNSKNKATAESSRKMKKRKM
ncbi:hypothetical protein ACOMHN_023836 [Nucella lapillus]